MSRKAEKAKFGPGGVRCQCCGGALGRRGRRSALKSARRAEDQRALEESMDLDDFNFEEVERQEYESSYGWHEAKICWTCGFPHHQCHCYGGMSR
jgi:hypothetical protein